MIHIFIIETHVVGGIIWWSKLIFDPKIVLTITFTRLIGHGDIVQIEGIVSKETALKSQSHRLFRGEVHTSTQPHTGNVPCITNQQYHTNVRNIKESPSWS